MVGKGGRWNLRIAGLQIWRRLGWVMVGIVLMAGTIRAEPVAVRYKEGLIRGFLSLSTLEGKTIAGGELSQSGHDGKITTRLTFHFRDGSLHDEVAEFSQEGQFRLVSYHLVQKGPSFPIPTDVTIDTGSNRVKVRYTDEDGKEQVETSDDELPADLANGLVLILVKNIEPGSGETVVSMLASTPGPQMVDLKITTAGKEPFTAAGVRYEATHYVVNVELGPIKGLLAKLLGKYPPDSHVWVVNGESPGFVKAERPFYVGGPPWRIELAGASWPRKDKAEGQTK